ncbi:MAG: T9SS type A sorting domain-containing protein [Bacteroidetes bacterium]|nr:T9SS type A sorting domain-containing protein [Bacteroidota bacterium]MBS1755945.1 T9SS type A sorting domain-containing protein [Bacteroidota bacterium]
MKKFFTLAFAALLLSATTYAQCTITGFDVCTGANPITSFTNAQLVSGSALATGSKYKFNNITSGIGALDAIITIDGSSNATLISFDDDNAADETGVAGSQSALFSPKISADANLVNAAKSGYVQFTITFYNHYSGNTLPPVGALPVPVANLNFLHFDMDGHTIGTNGYFREMGYVKMPSVTPTDLLNYGAVGTELTSGGIVNDLGDNWRVTYGSTTERDGISRCAQVIEKSVYALPQSSVSFRMGYDYKPASPYTGNQGKPARQYGSKFGCFSLPAAAPLPVTLTAFAVNYNNSVANVNWTTEQEINLSKYEILRSINGSDFQTINTIASRNSLAKQNYTYQDNNIPAAASVLYYKLRIIDKDGSYKYSNVVTVKVTAASAKDFLITPNPASTNAQIRFNAIKSGQAQIIVFDAAGKAVLQQQASVLAGNNSIALNNIVNLSEGMYTVRMIVNNESFSSKLIVWK